MQPNVSAKTHALMLSNEAALLSGSISRWYGYAQSCLTLCHPFDHSPPDSSVYGISQARMGCYFLLQGILATQGLNPCLLCLLHCGQILYPLSHQGSLSLEDQTNELCLFFFFLNWTIVDLQCCINFFCATKWLSYTYILFNIHFHYGLSQDTEYSSLSYIVTYSLEGKLWPT